MKKASLEVLLGLALVAAWIVVAAQAERSQRVGTGAVAEVEGTRLTDGVSPASPASSPGA